VGVLLALLVLLVALLYVSQIGLPAFLKAPLLAELQRRGLTCQFDRLAWRWYRGLVVEQATLRATADPTGPHAQAAEIVLDLSWRRLLRDRTVQLESLRVVEGHLVLPLHEPGQAPEECALERMGAAVRFLPGGQWDLAEFEASFRGATLQASGWITNAPALAARSRPWRSADQTTAAEAWRAPLREFVSFYRRLHFAEPPELRLRFRGDGRQPAAFSGELKGQAGGVEAPGLSLKHLRANAELTPASSPDGGLVLKLDLRVADARNPRGGLRQAVLTAQTRLSATNLVPNRIDWELAAQQARTPVAGFSTAHLTGRSERRSNQARGWQTDFNLAAEGITTAWGGARSSRCTATFEHAFPSPIPTALHLDAELEAAQTRWGEAARVRLETRLVTVTNAVSPVDPAWGAWAKLAGIAASWEVSATNLQVAQWRLDDLAVTGEWKAPHLRLTNLQTRLYGGSLRAASAHLEVDTRQVTAQWASDFDAHAVVPVLGRGATDWLAQFEWSRPPQVRASARAVLPPWADRAPHWTQQVLPTLVAEAQIEGNDAAFQGVTIQAARLTVGFSNEVLRLRDFHVTRPEGDAELAYDLHTKSQEFRWRLRANLNPKEVGPILDRQAPRVLSLFEFTGPAAVAGEVWGRWGSNKAVNLALGGVVTNFAFRGEPVSELRAGVRLTNQFLTATNLSLRTGTEWIRAESVGVDFVHPWIYLTNAEAQFDPLRFARVIGTNLVNTLSPYRFDHPPRVRAAGRVPARGAVDEADLRLTVAGGPFHFWRFNLPTVDGQVHWEGDRVTLTNVVGRFYGGELRGHLRAEVQTNGSALLAFRAAVTNVNLQPLVRDTIPTTNRIEGILQATLEVTRADSADWKSWNGSGRLHMRDGLLWDLPLFSVLSPMLNAVLPGLGNNRARAATGTFTITNSVMDTADLEIMAQLVRLAFRGTLDFDWNVRARVEAEVIPGAPLIGPMLGILFAPVTKALIFKIGGTLGEPELEPLLFPKVLLPAFRPFQTLRGFFSGPSPRPGTNAPAARKP